MGNDVVLCPLEESEEVGMRRVVVTGIGILSCIGQDKNEVIESLEKGKSGIRFMPEYQENGLRSQVAGALDVDFESRIDRRILRFMGDAAAYTYLAMEQAIADAGLSDELVSNPRTGLLVGSGGAATWEIIEAYEFLKTKGARRVGPYRVTASMCSTTSANLATAFHIKGLNYSISSACSTSAHCIGHAYEQIQLGKQDVVFAGGGEDEHYTLSALFDGMNALSTGYNDRAGVASRPYDQERDGFVIAGGGGILVLEELEHALARGADIYAEVVGYGTASDGADMVSPSGDGARRAMAMSLESVQQPVDYINAHGTSTPAGDMVELNAIKDVFGDNMPPISSTKALTGHSLGAAGVHEAIYCLLMLEQQFLAASCHIEQLDPAAADFPILRETTRGRELETVMSNSFGFGGTNVSLVFRRYHG